MTPPPPIGLVAIGTFFPTLKKVIFSLVAHPFSPSPLLVARPIRRELFLQLPLKCNAWNAAYTTAIFLRLPIHGQATHSMLTKESHKKKIFSVLFLC